MRRSEAITVAVTGSNITTAAISASVALPAMSSGTRPAYVRVTSTQAAYIKLGITAPTAAAGDLMVQPADSVILSVGGNAFIAAIQVATAGVVNVVPLEDIA
jgi:hypothetical protein